MNRNPSSSRSSNALSASRLSLEAENLDERVREHFVRNEVHSLEDLFSKLQNETLPSGFTCHRENDKILFLSIILDPDSGPKISLSLSIDSDLSFDLHAFEHKIPESEYLGLLQTKRGIISKVDEVLNLLAFLKNRPSSGSSFPKLSVEDVIRRLEDALVSDEILSSNGRFKFAIEQLKLSLKDLGMRRYSPTLMAAAALWEATSPALYRLLLKDENLSLPSVCHLKRFSQSLGVEAGISHSTCEYLKKRISRLNSRQRIVNLLFDEVYSSRRCEYSNGKFYGYDSEDGTSKTVLCFMITGTASSYRDIVCMVPLSKIDSEVINKWWWLVVQTLTEIGFRIVSSISDGHSANRKFVSTHLGCSAAQNFVINPYAPAPHNKIFPIFDTIHIFKGLWTNFLNKAEFECPPFLGQSVHPRFHHFQDLYTRELGSSFRYAHKLNHKVIYPKSIERTNVDLACRFFSESTRNALLHFADIDQDEWRESAEFVSIMLRYFNTINVKSVGLDDRKKDFTRSCVRRENMHDEDGPLQFLLDMLNWVEQWKLMSTKKKLSSETFFTLTHTLKGLVDLCHYLLETSNLDYILLGKVNSDPIERRFGFYRQLAGANFFVSLKQFFEGEKNIRLRSLVRFDKLSASELSSLCKDQSDVRADTILEDVTKLEALLQDPDSDDVHDFSSLSDLKSIVFCCSGKISRNLLRTNKCEECKDLIIQNKRVDFHFEEDSDITLRESLIRQADRGGLIYPSELVYLTTLFAVKLRDEIFSDPEVFRLFMSFRYPREVFVRIFEDRVNSLEKMNELLNQFCDNNHSFLSLISQIASSTFNFNAKNFCSKMNDEVHENRKRGSKAPKSAMSQKVAKLS